MLCTARPTIDFSSPCDSAALSDAYIETLVETVFAGLERQPKPARHKSNRSTQVTTMK